MGHSVYVYMSICLCAYIRGAYTSHSWSCIMTSHGLNVSTERLETSSRLGLISDWWHWRLGLVSIPSLQRLGLETLTSRSRLHTSHLQPCSSESLTATLSTFNWCSMNDPPYSVIHCKWNFALINSLVSAHVMLLLRHRLAQNFSHTEWRCRGIINRTSIPSDQWSCQRVAGGQVECFYFSGMNSQSNVANKFYFQWRLYWKIACSL